MHVAKSSILYPRRVQKPHKTCQLDKGTELYRRNILIRLITSITTARSHALRSRPAGTGGINLFLATAPNRAYAITVCHSCKSNTPSDIGFKAGLLWPHLVSTSDFTSRRANVRKAKPGEPRPPPFHSQQFKFAY